MPISNSMDEKTARREIVRIGELMYERWIAKFEKPRLKALHSLKQKLEGGNDG